MSFLTLLFIFDLLTLKWTLTEVLFAGLKGQDAFMAPPYHDLRHPLIFYYGHPATLYINKLRVAGLIEDPINAHFEDIFETLPAAYCSVIRLSVLLLNCFNKYSGSSI